MYRWCLSVFAKKKARDTRSASRKKATEKRKREATINAEKGMNGKKPKVSVR